jgi:pimeloyl-ACP methyl ester carboxylesterase
VLLHGFPQNRAMWDLLAPRLHAAGLRTVAPDQRGYSPGARPSEVDAYRVETLAGDVLSIMDSLGIGAAHVVGHDWGAVVGWRLASVHSGRVRTLTAVSVPHPWAAASALVTSADQRRRLAYFKLFRARGHRAERVLLEGDGGRMRAMAEQSRMPADRVERYVAAMRAPGALTGGLNWYRAMRRTDLVRYRTVRVATTFVWSDGDVAVGRTAAERCARHVRGSYRFVPLAGVSHWIPDEAPDALAEAVLDRVGASAPAE